MVETRDEGTGREPHRAAGAGSAHGRCSLPPQPPSLSRAPHLGLQTPPRSLTYTHFRMQPQLHIKRVHAHICPITYTCRRIAHIVANIYVHSYTHKDSLKHQHPDVHSHTPYIYTGPCGRTPSLYIHAHWGPCAHPSPMQAHVHLHPLEHACPALCCNSVSPEPVGTG